MQLLILQETQTDRKSQGHPVHSTCRPIIIMVSSAHCTIHDIPLLQQSAVMENISQITYLLPAIFSQIYNAVCRGRRLIMLSEIQVMHGAIDIDLK